MTKNSTIINLSKVGLVLALVGFLAVQVSVSAAVGDDKKKQKGVSLRIEGFDMSYAGKSDYSFFRRPGTLYSGTFSLLDRAPHSSSFSAVQTVKQGSTVYILPLRAKSKIPLSKFKVPEKPRN